MNRPMSIALFWWSPGIYMFLLYFTSVLLLIMRGQAASIFLSKSGMQHLWHGENNVCNVLVSIKVVLIKNDYFLHPKFELHTYQQMNGFLYWRSFHWKKYGSYISHELIVQLIPTWIWLDLLTIIHFWPSNHQLSYSF